MCRQNQLQGWTLLAFGIGLLVGQCVGSCFALWCLALGSIICGFARMKKKH